MYKTDEMYMHNLQTCLLSIIDDFASVCKRNKLRYYLFEGSLLGAVRHHGFIPWDDDVDIVMPRPDFEVFVHEFDTVFPEYLKLEYRDNLQDTQQRVLPNARILDIRHILVWDNFGYQEEINPWVDIFPLDGMPDRIVSRKIRYLNLLRKKLVYKFYDSYNIGCNRKRQWYEEIAVKLAKKLHLGNGINDARKKHALLEKELTKSEYDNSSYVICFFSEYKEREIFPRSWFGNGLECKFMNRAYIIPKNSDLILKQVYGKYEELPPVEERVPKHVVDFLY